MGPAQPADCSAWSPLGSSIHGVIRHEAGCRRPKTASLPAVSAAALSLWSFVSRRLTRLRYVKVSGTQGGKSGSSRPPEAKAYRSHSVSSPTFYGSMHLTTPGTRQGKGHRLHFLMEGMARSHCEGYFASIFASNWLHRLNFLV